MTDTRAEGMAAFRAGGASLQQIADRYGVSRQRVHQVLAEREGPPPVPAHLPRRRSARHSREKGVNFERATAEQLAAIGTVRGLEGSGDHLVVSPTDGSVLHVEAKRQERLRLPEWLEQLERDTPASARYALVFKQSRKRVYVVEPFDQFLAREALLADRES